VTAITSARCSAGEVGEKRRPQNTPSTHKKHKHKQKERESGDCKVEKHILIHT